MSRRELGRAALRRSFVILQAITAVSSGRSLCSAEKWQTLSMHPPPGYLYMHEGVHANVAAVRRNDDAVDVLYSLPSS